MKKEMEMISMNAKNVNVKIGNEVKTSNQSLMNVKMVKKNFNGIVCNSNPHNKLIEEINSCVIEE